MMDAEMMVDDETSGLYIQAICWLIGAHGIALRFSQAEQMRL
jgi:hypothetical protein